MSEVRLVIRDAQRDIQACRHGSFAERVVAAVSSEPETIEELDVALARFMAAESGGHFRGFFSGVEDEPYDAGVVIVDLAARLIVCESTYYQAAKTGYVSYHHGQASTKLDVRFHLSNDWQLSDSAIDWRAQADLRRRERAAAPPLDARAVLYGQPLLDFIARECFATFGGESTTAAVNQALQDSSVDATSDTGYQSIREIHIRWMTAPRDDLRGQTPREVMIARRDHISWDSQDRQEQWSLSGESPPGLHRESAAYRFAGFGTHELVVYYDMVRFLLDVCRQVVVETTASGPQSLTVGDFAADQVPRLGRLRDQWLDEPDPEFGGRTPRSIIERERMRLPEGVSDREAMIDCDCPLCQMQADMPGPVFWGIDGSSMDDDFAFSFCKTREEGDDEQREYEEFNRRFEARQAEQKRLGVEYPGGGYADPETVWRSSFSADLPESQSLVMRLFAIGFPLSELVVDLKVESPDEAAVGAADLVTQLNRDFGNLREVALPADFAAAAALAEPVIDRFCETLDEVSRARPQLEPKCADLQRRLRRFLEPQGAADDEGEFESWESDDLPF